MRLPRRRIIDMAREQRQSKKGENLRQIYDRLKKEFTAADLQKYTRDEPMVPAAQWLADMEAIYKAETQKRNQGNRNVAFFP
jgi:hypothetical protein